MKRGQTRTTLRSLTTWQEGNLKAINPWGKGIPNKNCLQRLHTCQSKRLPRITNAPRSDAAYAGAWDEAPKPKEHPKYGLLYSLKAFCPAQEMELSTEYNLNLGL